MRYVCLIGNVGNKQGNDRCKVLWQAVVRPVAMLTSREQARPDQDANMRRDSSLREVEDLSHLTDAEVAMRDQRDNASSRWIAKCFRYAYQSNCIVHF
jgi:hypothetical protein